MGRCEISVTVAQWLEHGWQLKGPSDVCFTFLCLIPKLKLLDLASFPGTPELEYEYAWRAWYLFSRDHDVIEIGPEFLEQKGNVLHIIQPTLRSMLDMYDIHSPIARYV